MSVAKGASVTSSPEQASGGASGLVLTSLFVFVPDHYVPPIIKPGSERPFMFGPEMMQQIDEIVLNQRRSDTSELRQNTNKDDGDAGQANQKRGWYSLFSGVRVFVCVCACLCVCVCVCVCGWLF